MTTQKSTTTAPSPTVPRSERTRPDPLPGYLKDPEEAIDHHQLQALEELVAESKAKQAKKA